MKSLQLLQQVHAPETDDATAPAMAHFWEETHALADANQSHVGFLTLVMKDLRMLVKDDYTRLHLLRFCENLRRGSSPNTPASSPSAPSADALRRYPVSEAFPAHSAWRFRSSLSQVHEDGDKKV